MTPKQQGIAHAQRNIECLVAWLKAGGYEDERAGVCERGGTNPNEGMSDDGAIFQGDAIPPIHTWWGTPKKERWFQKIWQRLKK